MQFTFIILWHGAICIYIYKQQYTGKTLTLRKCMCMRASELRKCWHFYILKLLFLWIFCRYIWYFVDTNDMLVGLHVPTNFQLYQQKYEKALLGGGGNCPPAPPPPPPPLATLMARTCACVVFVLSPGWWEHTYFVRAAYRPLPPPPAFLNNPGVCVCVWGGGGGGHW